MWEIKLKLTFHVATCHRKIVFIYSFRFQLLVVVVYNGRSDHIPILKTVRIRQLGPKADFKTDNDEIELKRWEMVESLRGGVNMFLGFGVRYSVELNATKMQHFFISNMTVPKNLSYFFGHKEGSRNLGFLKRCK